VKLLFAWVVEFLKVCHCADSLDQRIDIPNETGERGRVKKINFVHWI
jgi:hypothetical protein